MSENYVKECNSVFRFENLSYNIKRLLLQSSLFWYTGIYMNHQSLYRKYRPNTFAELLGQDSIVSSLEKIVASRKPSHAYLFTGSRGTGKTSTARIFARALGVDEIDIYEIDAASYRKVEDARQLREEVFTVPVLSPYKVYILDEVHMLTKDSFNTLLKVLEEPPAHVIFILATTEIDKVLDTIISRCQVYHFKQPPNDVLVTMLERGVTSEGYTADTHALSIIANHARGAFRDAWGLLERVISQLPETTTHITVDHVYALLGTNGEEALELIQCVINRDSAGIISRISQFTTKGIDPEVLMGNCIHLVRGIILYRFAPSVAGEIYASSTDDMRALLSEYATSCPFINSEMLLKLIKSSDLLRHTNMPTAVIELAFIDIFDTLNR